MHSYTADGEERESDKKESESESEREREPDHPNATLRARLIHVKKTDNINRVKLNCTIAHLVTGTRMLPWGQQGQPQD
jgi:hypothetical protein